MASTGTAGTAGLLDESTTWAEFGKRHLDRRVSKALTESLGLERPTLVQSRGIPVALEGKDLLCRARTGSGKTICYAVPMVQRLLQGARAPMRGLVLVPTKELIAQVHSVISALLTFCFDVLTVEPLLSGQKYMKAELPSILVTTPSCVIALGKQRRSSAKSTMRPLAETLQILVVDEADLMFSFGYEDDMKALCAMMPSTYQAVLVSATLSAEVEHLKGLMLHKPVVLKLEEPRVTGKLSQFYLVCHKTDKYLVLYTLLKLQLLQGKILIFVKDVQSAYKLKIFLERFSINAAVLSAELPHASRQNIIQAFNQGLMEILVATDSGCAKGIADETGPADDVEWDDGHEEDEGGEEEECEGSEEEDGDDDDEFEGPGDAKAPKVHVEVQKMKTGTEGGRRLGKRQVPRADSQFSLTRGVDLKDVTTVVNADIPTTVRDYVHRVGRCARGGASGTALTICSQDEEESKLEQIIKGQAASGAGEVKPLPMQISDAERFRYRVEDQTKGLTKKVVDKYRARELQTEALNSEKLTSYFEENPEEKRALQRSQRQLREKKSIRSNLRTVPGYLVPEGFAAGITPVQQAVRDDAAKSGKRALPARLKRQQILSARRRDPLQAFAPEAGGRKGKKQAMRERMLAIDRRIDSSTANPDNLPPLSGKKLWKMTHKKPLRKGGSEVIGDRKRLTVFQKARKRKFPHG